MNKFSNISNILKPSLLSGVLTYIIVLYVFITSLYESINAYSFSKGYIDSIENSKVIIASTANPLSSLLNQFLTYQIVNTIAFVLFWVLIGVLFYVGIAIIIRGYSEFKKIVSLDYQNNSSKSDATFDFITRIVFKLFMSLLFIFAVYVYASVLIPISALSFQAATNFDLQSLVYVSVAIIIISFSTHMLAVIARFSVMRQRVFN